MMTTRFISSLNLWNAPRTGLGRLQSELATATREVVEGRHADMGLALGTGVGLGLSLRQQSAEIDALRAGNAAASLRLTASQSALKQMQAGADAMLKDLLGASPDQRAAAVSGTAASALAALTTGLNTTAAGQYVFAGTNTGTRPATPYLGDPASAAKTALDTAFRDFFGFPQGDAAAARVTAAEMKGFLDGPLTQLFSDASWAQWSSASNTAIDSRIALGETVTTSVSANAAPVRRLAMAYVMASDLGLQTFSGPAQAVVTDRMIDLLGGASAGLVSAQADLGRVQGRVTLANERLDSQKTLLAGQIDDLEAVDPAEAKARVDAASTQIQMSYALTAQLRQLSLISFIS